MGQNSSPELLSLLFYHTDGSTIIKQMHWQSANKCIHYFCQTQECKTDFQGLLRMKIVWMYLQNHRRWRSAEGLRGRLCRVVRRCAGAVRVYKGKIRQTNWHFVGVVLYFCVFMIYHWLQMANQGLGTHSNTFWDILGNQIWSFPQLMYHRNISTIQEQSQIISTNIILHISKP